MNRITLLGALGLIMVMGAINARAAAPALPPNAIAADTILVVHVEAGRFTADQILAARGALLGPEAAKGDDKMKELKEGIDKVVAAGAEAVTLVAGESDAPDAVPLDDSPAIFYVRPRAGADLKAIKAALVSAMPPDNKGPSVIEEVNGFLVMHEKGKPLPVKGDAGRAALFAEALGTMGDASIQIAFIPDAPVREMMAKLAQRAPKGVKEAVPQLAASKWTAVAIMLGHAPSFSITVNTGTDADAKSLIENINVGLDSLKGMLANPALAPIVGPMIDGLRPVQLQTKVAIVAKPETVKSMANLALKLMGAAAEPTPKEKKE